jgi:ABC-2 type transport system ATP-binding protein
VGAPQLKLSYTGTSPAGARPTRVFAQLVDDATGIVLGNQITPIQVTLDGKPHQTSVPLEVVAYTAHAGAHVTLQMVATTKAYAEPRLGGSITFDSIDVSLPVAAGLKAR